MKNFSRTSLAFALVCLVVATALAAFWVQNEAPLSRQFRKSMTAAPLPEPTLSATDHLTYRKIFELQEKGEWKTANRKIAQLNDPLLMGYVKAQRYLHPRYISTPKELSVWLARYNDLPQADAIHSLALRKGVKHSLVKNKATSSQAITSRVESNNARNVERFGSALINRHLKGSPLRSEIRSRLIADNRLSALAALNGTRNIRSRDYDLLRWYIAGSFFNHGEYAQAASLANASALRSGKEFPAFNWIAGIGHWHQGNIEAAYKNFSAMADAASPNLSIADKAAASFWAYRATKRLEGKERAMHYLQQAAMYPDTFYGIQASKALEQELSNTQNTATLTASEMEVLLRSSTIIRRMMALHEIGRTDEAEQELRQYYPTASTRTQTKLFALANLLELPAAQIRMETDLAKNGVPQINYALYPTPNLRPRNGYAVDPSLLFAIARQESGFNSRARSHAGAAGVMQIMPETARYLLRRARYNTDNLEAQMHDPATSLALGQQYIRHLQQQPAIGDNLIYLIAAYNAGSRPLISWKEQMNDKNDPLLFVESIPFVETRGYVLNVLNNYWIYSDIMGNNTVHAMLDGTWPLYQTGKQEIADAADALRQRTFSKNAL
jgi:soluble lytic murein transglycosylase